MSDTPRTAAIRNALGLNRHIENGDASVGHVMALLNHSEQLESELAEMRRVEREFLDLLGPDQSITCCHGKRHFIPATDPNRPECLYCKAEDAARYRWLRERVTYYNVDADWPVDAPNVPVLAQVSERIWYHATDDITHCTLDELIDAALAQEPPK